MSSIRFMSKAAAVPMLLGMLTAGAVAAGPLEDRIEAGEPIRLGFSAAPPWAYRATDGTPRGFVNGIAIDVLENMGYTNIEPVLTDWSGLIPSLQAGRVDMVTGGMYILKARCENMDFSDPIGAFGDAFVVLAGNPENLETYQDLIDKDLKMVAPSGYNTIGDAKDAGVPDSNIVQGPTPTETLPALRAGRVTAVATNVMEAKLAADSFDEFEMSDPAKFVGRDKQVVGIGFHPDDDDFREKFNEALQEYLGTEQMMETVTPDDYIEAYLPEGQTTEDACKAG